MTQSPPSLSLPERLRVKFTEEPNSGCWLWTGALNGNGYGAAWNGARTVPAHRAIYEILRGPIPPGLVIDHLCRVLLCVNPDHLRVVTSGENVLAGISPSAQNARKTSCSRGHPLSGKNLYTAPNGDRRCCECGRVAWRNCAARRRQRIKEAASDRP